MNYKRLRFLLFGVALFSAATAGAQQFDTELQMSNAETTCWYRICSAVTGMQDFVMTDCSSVDETYPVQLLKTETTDEKSQWKLTAGEDGKVILTNRATGKQLNNVSVAVDIFNVTQLTDEGAPGFKVTELGDAAFSLQGVEDDGVNRCLTMVMLAAESIHYPTGDLSTSAIAWKFTPVETVVTGIGSAKSKAVIRVTGRRVYVSGCPKWQLFNAKGEEMPCTTRLAPGVYVVKTPMSATKVVVF